MNLRSGILGLGLLLATLTAQADLRIAATVPNLGMLAEQVGGEHVQVNVMAPADRDPHYLEARPSMMAALRRADLVVAVGAELEMGWLPAAIRGANNPAVQPGRGGYFEAAAHVDLIDAGRAADRAGGDVHPMGNPHTYLDPIRMTRIAHALADRMARIQPEHADTFQANAEAFGDAVRMRMPEWEARTADAPGVVLYHEDGNYLMHRFNVPILGFLEPLPGIPPTAKHIRSLAMELAGQDGMIIHQVYQSSDHVQYLAEQVGWPVYRLQSQVDPGGDQDAYFRIIDAWVDAVSGR